MNDRLIINWTNCVGEQITSEYPPDAQADTSMQPELLIAWARQLGKIYHARALEIAVAENEGVELSRHSEVDRSALILVRGGSVKAMRRQCVDVINCAMDAPEYYG